MSESKKIRIGIINMNIHNIHNIFNSCIKAGFKTHIIQPNDKYFNSNIVILPGVGSFRSGAEYLKKNFFHEKLKNFLQNKNNILFGICLGMQLLLDKSEEFGSTKGLGLISGSVKKLKNYDNSLVPQIGWNKIIVQKENKLIDRRLAKNFFYFVHSYFCDLKNNSEIMTKTVYGKNNFVSSIYKSNIYATQFHPEKSGPCGIKILKNLKKLI